jgi:hypothetical protein
MAHGWQTKRLHRLILLSRAYQQSSLHPLSVKYTQKDALNRYLWRFPRRRLDADALRDAVLATSGTLNLKMGGAGFTPSATREALEGLSRKGAEWNPSTPDEQNRRSVYMFLKRALIMPLMTAFDFGDTTAPLEQRDVTTVAPQALTLLNNPFLQAQSEAFARRVEQEAGKDRTQQVVQAWRIAFGHSPSEAEKSAALAFLLQTPKAKPAEVAPRANLKPDLRLWLRAESAERDAEGRVLRWKDLSGNGHNAAQTLEGARPLWVSDVGNGHPALRFDGKGNFLGLEGAVLQSPQFTIFAVVTDTAGESGHREIFSNWNRKGQNIGTSVFLGLTGKGTVRLTDAFPSAGTISQPEKPFLLTSVSELGAVAVYQNRHELSRAFSPLPTRNLAPPYTLGQQGDIGGEFWKGDILELRVYGRGLTEAEREQVWDELGAWHKIAPRLAPADAALASLCHVLLNANEFIYVD